MGKKKSLERWALRWHSKNRLDGISEHFMFDDCLPLFFRTRNLARIYCNCRFGYIKHRKDLRTEPHGWRVPRAIKVRITIEELP